MSNKFSLTKPHLYEIWVDKEYLEWTLFSPEDHTALSYDNLIRDHLGHVMNRVASMKCTFKEAKIVQDQIFDDYDASAFNNIIN